MAKVAIIEGFEPLLGQLAEFLLQSGNLEVIITATSMESFFEQLNPAIPPDVILLDINLNGQNSLEWLPTIKAKLPECQVIITTSHTQQEFLMQAVQNGADSYYIKGSDLNLLLQAIQETLKGGSFLAPQSARSLIDTLRNNYTAAPPCLEDQLKAKGLIKREIQIATGLFEELSYQEIADHRHIGLNTVRHYVKSTYRKLGINSREELLKMFRK